MFRDIFQMRLALAKELGWLLKSATQEPAAEMILVPMPGSGTQYVSARVICVERDFAVVEAVDGRHGVLNNAEVDYSRIIVDMRRQFRIGDILDGAFQLQFDGQQKYTMLAGQLNPWPRFAAEFREGSTVVGQVTAMVDGVGSFVQMVQGVDGLIPGKFLPLDTEVEAVIARFDIRNRRINLRLVRVLRSIENTRTVVASDDLPAVGEWYPGEVVKVVPQQGGRGGYILVRLPHRGVLGAASYVGNDGRLASWSKSQTESVPATD
jgi:hypothetical protein